MDQKKIFFTFYNVLEKNSQKINKNHILNSHSYLKNKSFFEILNSQKKSY